MSNRRDFLKNISLFTAGGLLAGKAGSVACRSILYPKNYIKVTWPLIFGR